MDVKTYMQGVGRQARAASRLIAKADTATKNQALTVMAQALAVHTLADTGLIERVDRSLFEHAGAYALLGVLAIVPFEDDAVDPGLVQKMAKQQASGSGADDRDLRFHTVVRIDHHNSKNTVSRSGEPCVVSVHR